MSQPRYSIIVPVYNRPEEIDELLSSLLNQTYRDFEVVIVEDGSTIRCDTLIDRYRDSLQIRYFFKPNSGPGPSRNFGFEHARGNYLVVFDSDCLLPPEYFQAVESSLRINNWDAWGGPDRAHERFTATQQAMAYTMSSFLTTGGIRGKAVHIGAFQPRSFNMGMSRRVFEQTGGFRFSHFAEDIELSIRMRQLGLKVGLITEAFVYHKRRATFAQFYRQVSNFGRGRVQVGRAHPNEVKITHWFPALFLIALVALLPLGLISTTLFTIGALGFTLYLSAILIHSYLQTRNVEVALLSVPSALVQMIGYGSGFLKEKFSSTDRTAKNKRRM
ncbi:glycosyltransferase [Chryseolinea sp. T2]|uniref:glycosyltransferase n=1 Tax=Chryseolinea sp. T2 TaxID=3129255 RepID=UPI003077587D